MKRLKKIVLYLSGLLILLCVGLTLFMNLNPAFGGNPTEEQEKTYQHFVNYVDGKFVNEVPTQLMISYSESLPAENSVSKAMDIEPPAPIPVSPIDWKKLKVKKIV